MIETNISCRRCIGLMIGIEFVRHYRVVCNNDGCDLFREGQGNIERAVELAPIKTFMPAPLPKTPSPPRKKIIRRKGLVYARKTF